jgi:hypothetical protein
LTPLSDLVDDRALHGALQLSLESLLRTVRTFVSGTDLVEWERRVQIEEYHLTRYVLALIDEAVETERRDGLALAPVVRRYLTSSVSLEDVVDRIALAHARPNPSFVEGVRQFSAMVPSLIQATQDQVRPS